MSKMSQSVAARVEELLREQLSELGIEVSKLEPHVIAENMKCDVFSDDSMIYYWKGDPILRVMPESSEDGTTSWRMFTKDDLPAQ
ncbi:hypothetical protein [Halodesulfovibrio marinisediminis]|uniref:Uncharacterized protein n=1 Tax=Halodesulfovibrio marinisediminis DSM 17456 TaxID=1121457 RepID=A0A1N6IRJ6_9BACT|nr:hypothetical protein [Halodesulfovibrio marinisediminis]SIO34677.1 hypothetical protein SAMN02745161_2861 [Halodesulfovibrio marinisediminis DSM 17456]